MLTGHSLSKISRCAGVVATIEYMLKDIRLLETYLQRMASAITQKREQISHSALLLSMFHYEMSSLSLYDPAFKEMLLKAVEQERIIQRKLFVAGNSTEVTPYLRQLRHRAGQTLRYAGAESLQKRWLRGELELSPERRRAGSAVPKDGGVLPAAKWHESARFRPAVSREAGANAADADVAPCLQGFRDAQKGGVAQWTKTGKAGTPSG